jgi:mono/diheme cytochrome c family protein
MRPIVPTRFAIFALAAGLFAGSLCGCGHAGSPAAQTASPRAIAGNQGRGADIFRADCAACHTVTAGSGGVGPSLAHERAHKNYAQTVSWIEAPEPPMPKLYPAPLSDRDVADVAAYVESL